MNRVVGLEEEKEWKSGVLIPLYGAKSSSVWQEDIFHWKRCCRSIVLRHICARHSTPAVNGGRNSSPRQESQLTLSS